MGPIRPATAEAYIKLGKLIEIFENDKTAKSYTAVLNCFIEECGGTSKVCKELDLIYGRLNTARQTGGHKVDPFNQTAQMATIKEWVAPMLPAPVARAHRI